jgi:hypothetical protein
MKQHKHSVGKVISCETQEVLGTVFSVLWQNRAIYITAADIVPSSDGLLQKIVSQFKSSVEFEDAQGNRAKAKLVGSHTQYGLFAGLNPNIAVFEVKDSPDFCIPPFDLAKKESYKIQKAKFMTHNDDGLYTSACKTLSNNEEGFIQLTESIGEDLHLKGAPIISFSERLLFGFYNSENFMHKTKTLSPKKIANLQTLKIKRL